jgi:WD40 repeat protein
MNTTEKNPYIGPRTFLKEERHLFFGRDREARDLSALVASDKLVLFYAQSGAGKSSLINTRLIPELEDKLYEVLPVARVSGNWPEGDKAPNIYIYDLMRSLLHREIEPNALINLPLAQFLAKLNEDEQGYFYDSSLAADIRKGADFVPWRRALIIDQFEELFSTHPEAWQQREDFFKQLASAMEDDLYLWVVLVMREDYIALLDPYAHLLPGGLRTRYYMQRLSREAAIKAVQKPVEGLRPYEAGVAEKLVEDLSSIKVQRPDGMQELQPGQYVEPVQLQVVCYGLWENLPSEGTSITQKDLLEVGDVDEALGKYYQGRVAGVSEAKNVKERLIRSWIERKLIAPGGIRSMVMQETGKRSGGVSDDVIQALQSDLVRAENRGGTVWYELTHDRLVGPIVENNRKWFDENLSPLQRQASIWNDQDRNESWLLRDQALVEVEDWAKANPEELTDLETEFLEACREQQEQIKLNEQARSAQRLRRFLTVVGALALVAIIAAVAAGVFGIRAQAARADANQNLVVAQTAQVDAEYQAATAQVAEANAKKQEDIANTERAKAEQAADAALSGSLVAQANSLTNTNYPLALLIAIEAHQRAPSLLTRTTLFHLLQFTRYTRYPGLPGPISSVAVSPNGDLVAVASCSPGKCSEGGIFLYDANMQPLKTLSASTLRFGPVYSLAFYGDTLAAGGCVPEGCAFNKGQITLWDVSDTRNPKQLADTSELPVSGHTRLVKTVAFSHDGKLLASGSYDTNIILWDLSKPESPTPVGQPLGGRGGHSSFVNSVAFSPADNFLLSGGDDTTIRLWNLEQPETAPKVYEDHTAPVNSIEFSPDGKTVASAGDDTRVLLWNWDDAAKRLQEGPRLLAGHSGYVRSLAFHSDGSRTLLASAGFDNKIILWDASTGQQIGAALSVHTGAINSLAFGIKESEARELLHLISGSDDRSVIQWDLSAREPLSSTMQAGEEVPAEQNLTATNDQYKAQVNAINSQQIDVVQVSNPEAVFLTLDDFDSPVQYVGFKGEDLLTREENQVATNQVTLWSIQDSRLVARACEAVSRNLTATVWQEFERILGQAPKQTCVAKP